MVTDKNSWRKCLYCGRYISFRDMEDGRKVKFIEMCDYNENDYGFDIPDYIYIPSHRKCWNRNQKKREKYLCNCN